MKLVATFESLYDHTSNLLKEASASTNARYALYLLLPALSHIQACADSLVKAIGHEVALCDMWGLIFLDIKVSPRWYIQISL